ncbi:MAG: hypothetical protein IJC81_02355 [Clostridia bacterium]|nr:hypothetical protein [Clostridia bacterium]
MRLLKAFFRKKRTDAVDGDIQEHIDKSAPKTIISENIIYFQCEFSTVTIADDIPIEHGIYTLFAELKDGAVRGKYDMRTRNGSGEQFPFRQSHRFMKELQMTVGKYDFAKFNGEEYFVSGLPDMYGARIRIVYASGERIDASDNQSNFLPIDAMTELVQLFLNGGRLK